MRVFLVLLLAIAAGSVFAFATYNYVQNMPAKVVSIPTKPVMVAAADLDIGAEITAENVRTINWPANSVPQFAYSDPKDVIGRGIVMPMIQNEPFLPMKLAGKDGGAGLTPAIPPGLRAVGQGQRSDRRRRLRPAGHARGRRRDREPHAQPG
jgi:pilus assembly protein CpaB